MGYEDGKKEKYTKSSLQIAANLEVLAQKIEIVRRVG